MRCQRSSARVLLHQSQLPWPHVREPDQLCSHGPHLIPILPGQLLFHLRRRKCGFGYNQMPLPEPKEAYEHIEHFSDLRDDVHFAGPNKPDRPEMPEVLSAEWIDQLGPPSLLEQDDPDAYAYLLRERMGDLPTDSQFAVLLVKLLCDLEWFEQRYAVIEAKLLYPQQEVNERATQQRAPEDEEASVQHRNSRSRGGRWCAQS
jgi:hypothetical protein